MQCTLAGTFELWEPAIDYERDAACPEASAEKGTVAVWQDMIQDGASKSIVLHEEQGVP